MSATAEQRQAIEARGKVLVSASAGAGKTTVMISRLADIIEEGASLDNVLAVTFTKKAAAQMKDKLRRELIKRLGAADGEKREHIRSELGKVSGADISTIHSFCARLIRTHFYALDVDSSFEVLSDGAESTLLRTRAVDELFEQLYAEKDADLLRLLSTFRKKRSDAYLKSMLLAAYDEVRLRPDYVALLNECSLRACTDEWFDTVCGRYYDFVASRCRLLDGEIVNFEQNFSPAAGAEAYRRVLDDMRKSLITYFTCGDLFAAPDRLTAFIKPKVREETAEADAEFAAFAESVKKRYKALIKDISSRGEERKKFLESGALAQSFISLIKRFDEVYYAVKRDEGKLDYSDLEHYALRLLRGGECDGDVREKIRAQYKYVFVDEYQDVNPIQDEIISAVGGGDVFCVGDLKQAIYGFRGSRSRFFAEKCREEGRQHVVLPDNFRSSRKVIDFVNGLFSGIMRPPLGEFDYADGHAMRGGERYADGFTGEAEICLFKDGDVKREAPNDVYSVAEGEKTSRTLSAEGLAVLSLIEESLKKTYYDPDGQTEKKIQTGDICVLTRKRSNAAVQALMRAVSTKYPVAGVAETNICDRPEIKCILAVLSYIDNGEQDIPLAAAMLSPLGGFTRTQLAEVRLYGNGTGAGRPPLFRECVKMLCGSGRGALADKLNAFLGRVDKIRTAARSIGAARVIDELVAHYGFASVFDGENKLASLQRLRQEAYGPSGELTLSAFLLKIKACGNKIPVSASLMSDCVKVMTMHASKGLEFPVVIVADIAALFTGDAKDDMPFDEELGFAPKYYDAEKRTYSTTLLRKLVKARAEREELSNEINLFYVACTRAKYALHVLTSRAEKFDLMRALGASDYASLFDVTAFNPRILPVQSVSDSHSNGGALLDDTRADGQMTKILEELRDFEYKYATGTGLPVKSSASRILELKGGGEDAQPLFTEDGEEAGSDAIERGVAYHRFLELCDFARKDKEGVEEELSAWLEDGLITYKQRQMLNTDGLVEILNMPAFDSIGKKRDFREREFICRLPSADYRAVQGGASGVVAVGEDDGNGVIVQGAIDLLLLSYDNGRVVGADIIDYKYSGRTDGQIKSKYAPQLALYKSVVCKIYGLGPSAVTTTILNIKRLRQLDMSI